jgi:hypothetical protein
MDVEDPGVDLSIDNGVYYLRLVIGISGLLTYLLYYILQGIELTLDLSFGLLNTKALPVYDDELWAFLVLSNIVLGPVDHHLLEIFLRYVLFVFVACFAAVEDLCEFVVNSSCESQCVTLFAT